MNEKAIFIFADADNLKRTNDTFGHAAGDVLIKAMAQIIEEKTPVSCHVARKGGDEFVALAIVPTWANELKLLKGISDSLNCVYDFEGTEVSMSCCIGASIATNSNTLVKGMELEADKALYQAKSQGIGQVKIFDEELDGKIRSIQILANDIGKALQDHQLSVLYQPIICLKSHKVVSVEALVRWNHPALGPIEPPKILAAIQSEGLGSSFLEFLLKTTAQQASLWPKKVGLSVNICSGDLQKEGLDLQVTQFIESGGLLPNQLCLEITETELLLDNKTVQTNLMVLRELGVKIALDDFGTGYSSLSYLGKYPIDILKIDRSLVSNLERDRSNQIMVQALQDFAATKDLKLIVEGVETNTTAQILLDCGVPMAQGFLFHKPMTGKVLCELLESQKASKFDKGSSPGNLLQISHFS